jgi:hypothetical protein
LQDDGLGVGWKQRKIKHKKKGKRKRKSEVKGKSEIN